VSAREDDGQPLIQVTGGHPDATELAALTAVVLLVQANSSAADPRADGGARTPVRWRRLERQAGFDGPRSWRRV